MLSGAFPLGGVLGSVRTIGAVIRFERRHEQQFADEFEPAIQQEGAVKEQKVLPAALRVAGEF